MRNRKQLPLEALRPFELELPAAPAPLDFSAIFGNAGPVELEVGFGKGAVLLAAAQMRPDQNYLGIEIDRGLERFVATRLAKRSLRNVKVIHGDATRLLGEYITPNSLAAVHVYCPDPWWKKRHHKRRVFTPEFARHIERALAPGGELHLATDVAAYFVIMTGLVCSATELYPLRPPAAIIATNFEVKAIRRSKSVWRASYRKA